MGEQPAKDIWDVVYSGSRIFVGKIIHSNVKRDPDYIDRWPNEGIAVVLCPCFEIITQTAPVQLPDGRVGMSREIIVEPVLLNFEEACITLTVTAIIEGHRMKDNDQTRYKRAVDSAIKAGHARRAHEAGLTIDQGSILKGRPAGA